MKLLREYIRELLVEWELANDKNLMLDQEGMEKTDRENVSRYLKSLGLIESLQITVFPFDKYTFPIVPYPLLDSLEGLEDLRGVLTNTLIERFQKTYKTMQTTIWMVCLKDILIIKV